ncbi:nucleotidyltransferase substrate binding protein [Microaerobacter geothermalis]|uniref:HI0074 family nucleotidyltransferase substrate-binding subunit n=1 Tax=Microaerobacter geothermalis TaxID=674972 RepID=UPI001F3DEE09|nr:HI0074 family nucleotidyltransferase substrate-binding subunit [Microaerobacter geothermalis]MCF6093418.1 nucleotidyltransferase substrate binding protein [Microaerobacter geothermalis]
MERLRERLTLADHALKTLEEVLKINKPTAIERDASIQRFEYTFEVVWKAVKQYLYDIEGLDIASPKGVVRTCREIGILNDEETIKALKMIDDRNLTVHTYNESLAKEILKRLPNHMSLMKNWLKEVNTRISND